MADSTLARLKRRYRELAEQIRDLGFIATGSVSERHTVCATDGCRCHHDPPERHGPYLQHTRKVAGKTVTTRLTPEQAQRYRDEIGNRRRLDEIIASMSEISAQARELSPAPTSAPSPAAPATTDRSRPSTPAAHTEVTDHNATEGNPANTPRRDDNETTPTCPICNAAFTPIRRQRYCSPACRQAAWRARHPATVVAPPVVVPPRTSRRDITVYQCPECETRYLGEQWCHACNRPCTRVDLGGLCPHCDEPITFQDITDQHPKHPRTTQTQNSQ
jgi:hypothetical protein